jgi:hypothetical protein
MKPGSSRHLRSVVASAAFVALTIACGLASVAPVDAAGARTFATADDAVRALVDAAKASKLDALLALFGPGGQELASSSDPTTAKQNRDVFVVAMAEGWKLVDKDATHKELVVGHEEWPFPVPLVKNANGWMFDTAAGKQEVLNRRIGKNELAAIKICQTYAAAQQQYARKGHDGKPAGLYARRIASQQGRQDGLYWVTKKGEPLSPLGPLVAEATAEGREVGQAKNTRVPFHGYYFRVLEQQGENAPGGAKSYVVDNDMSGGFALVAWPAQYDATGVMTFIVGPDGVVREKDLGRETATAVAKITSFDPDKTWSTAQ